MSAVMCKFRQHNIRNLPHWVSVAALKEIDDTTPLFEAVRNFYLY